MPDPFSALGNVLGGGVKDLAGGVFNALSQWLWGAGLEILKAGVGLADKFGSVNLDVHSGPMAAVWSVTLPIGLAIAGCLFYFSLATVPFQGRGGVLRAVRGIGQFGVALAGSVGAFASLIALSDALTSFILSKGLSSANFDEAFTHTGFSDVTANAVKGGALALMSLFGVIPIGLGFAFENVMRAATIYLLAAVIPITAAGLLSGNTASWYWKTAHWMMAAIAMKPVMALALTLGIGIAGGGQGLVALIVGLAVLFVALFAPLALFRLFAFASEKATDGFKSGWGSSGAEDAVHGATDTVTSMVSGSDSTSSMESSTDARYSDASSSTDTDTDTDTGTGDSTGAGGSNSAGDSSSTGAAGGGGAQTGGTASEAVSAETGSDTPGTDTDRQQQAPGGDEQGANGTGETADAHAVQQGDVAATTPADVPGQGGTDTPPVPDAAGASQQPAEQETGSSAQQPAEQGAGSGAQQEQMPAPPTPAGGGSGEQSPAPSSSAGGAGDGAQAPSAPSSSGGSGDGAQAPSAPSSSGDSGDGAQAPGAPPGSSGGAPAPQPFANDAARSGGGGGAGSSGGGAGGSGGGAAGGAGAGDAAAAAAV